MQVQGPEPTPQPAQTDGHVVLPGSSPGPGFPGPQDVLLLRHHRCARLTVAVHLAALRVEPSLTGPVSGGVAIIGGRIHGLTDSVKTLPSLLRKLRADCLELNLDPEVAVARIRDAIRYTVVLDVATFSRDVKRLRRHLLGCGIEITKRMNYFVDGNRYMAVHDELRTRDGFLFEIQYHTENSLAAKQWSRDLFAVVRDPHADVERRQRAYDIIVAHSVGVAIPRGVTELGEAKRSKRPGPVL